MGLIIVRPMKSTTTIRYGYLNKILTVKLREQIIIEIVYNVMMEVQIPIKMLGSYLF